MKKFFAAIVFALFVAVSSTASADVEDWWSSKQVSVPDTYAYSEDGIDYYVFRVFLDIIDMRPIYAVTPKYVTYYDAHVKMVSGGKETGNKILRFHYSDNGEGRWDYSIMLIERHNLDTIHTHCIEKGYLSNSSKAQAVFNITRRYLS